MENFSLSCNNKKVFEFYQQHQNIDFETMNILFVNILEELNKDISTSLSNNIAVQLLSNVKNLHGQITIVNENINGVNESINKLHTETTYIFGSKFNEFRNDYIKDITLLLHSNTLDKIGPLLKENTGNMIDKTFIMINELIPKNNEVVLNQVRENLKTFHSSINDDTNKLLSSSLNQQNLSQFIQNIETKLSSSQQLINSIINASEQRLETKINDVREISSTNQHTQLSLQNNVSDLLKKMEISSVKGKCSENILFNILQLLYPSAQIESVGEQKETGDIMLIRKNKPTILIENKNWSKNVVQEEVKKFIRDVELQNCCGLFLSQNYGIANKENFEININNKNILLYVHATNNDAEKIKIAIDIIDNFKLKLDELTFTSEGYNIDTETLDEINKEYQTFITHKCLQIKTLKEFSSKMIKQLDEMQMPSLEKFLSKKYATSSSKYICEFCDYIGKNQSAMSAHKRGCKVYKSATCISPIEEENVIDTTESLKIEKPKKKTSKKN